jgi:hypothetical protein
LTKVLAQAENYDCTCGEWSEQPCHPKPDSRSDGILLSNVPPVNEIMLWTGGLLASKWARVAGYGAQHYLILSRVQAPAWTAVFCRAVRSHGSPIRLKSLYTG